MGLFGNLFGKKAPAPSATGEDEVMFRRAEPQRPPTGSRSDFMAQVAAILEVSAAQLDANASLVEGTGLTDLDICEFVQIAEEVWGVQLMPNPAPLSAMEGLTARFPTLEHIISAAEEAARR